MTKFDGIYYEVQGKGEPLLLIPGFTMNHLAWTPVLDSLKARFQVILIDNRGAGRSEVPKGPYSIEQMAADAVGVLDRLKIEKAHFLGQSMGSAICQMIAKMAPKRVDKMILAGTFAKVHPRIHFAFESFGRLFAEGLPFHRVVELFFPYIFSDASIANPAFLGKVKQLILEDPYPMTVAGYQTQLAALEPFNSEKFLKDIRAETLVIGYENDLCTFLDDAKYVAHHIPNARLAVMPNAGHAGHNEDPSWFSREAVSFLSS